MLLVLLLVGACCDRFHPNARRHTHIHAVPVIGNQVLIGQDNRGKFSELTLFFIARMQLGLLRCVTHLLERRLVASALGRKQLSRVLCASASVCCCSSRSLLALVELAAVGSPSSQLDCSNINRLHGRPRSCAPAHSHARPYRHLLGRTGSSRAYLAAR